MEEQYQWIRSRRIKNEIIRDLHDLIIDVGIVNPDNQFVSFYSEQWNNYQDRSKIYLKYFLDIHGGVFITIAIDSNYPFSPPVKVIINGHNYLSLLGINPQALKLVGLEGCLCCSSLTCGNNWSPSDKIKSIIQEIENNMNIKKKIVTTILTRKICHKYLFEDLNICQYLH